MFLLWRIVVFFKQNTAYEMRISDWSSDVCSSDLAIRLLRVPKHVAGRRHVSRIRPTFDSPGIVTDELGETVLDLDPVAIAAVALRFAFEYAQPGTAADRCRDVFDGADLRSEEHTSELQSLMRISYAVFCLKNKKHTT